MKLNAKKLEGLLKKWILAILDVGFFVVANSIVCYISDNGRILDSAYGGVLLNTYHLVLTCAITLGVNYVLRLYKSVWTFVSTKDILNCVEAAFVNSALLCIIDRVLFHTILKQNAMPFYAYVICFIILIVFYSAPRIGYRILRSEVKSQIAARSGNRHIKRIMIVGAGYMGNAVINDIKSNVDHQVAVVAVDDNIAKRGKRLNGVKIAGAIDDIPELVKLYDVDEIIICIPSATKTRINEIYKIATSTHKIVKTTPSLSEMMETNDMRSRVRRVEITDLLARDEVKLNINVCKYLIDTTILVTGGGGSIGSELCKQCARYNPKTIVIFDIYENCAFELHNELRDKYGDKINIQVRIGSVRDTKRLDEVFEEFHPDVVFHAAAHKHVPLMEDSPCEAVKNNVFGTYNVAVAADKFKVPKMVILSTDKAVNPTNVMGCTKRITEIIVQHMNEVSENTQYAAVRFGNVLGSHGSVIPIFKKQIEEGGPICVTHPDITRYFMTIPEAAQLVCQAGGLAKGGEVFVLDMGEPVKIMDLAESLIKLSGFTVDEIGIKIVGLRPGEKLYEELSMESELETREKTANEKIFVNQPMVIENEQFDKMLVELNDINDDNVREKLMSFVPNYHPAKN